MANAVKMPKLGMSVESCIMAKWHKKKGDAVKKGELLFSYETDKATNDHESAEEGVILEIFFNEGDEVPVMENVCVIGKAGEKYDEFLPVKSQKPQAQPAPGAAPPAPIMVDTPLSEKSAATPEGFTGISPRAKILAQERSIDISTVNASGAEGRICEKDILSALGGFGKIQEAKSSAKGPDMPMFADENVSNMRKAIAKSMHASLSNMAQLTLNSSFDATNILAFRSMLKQKAKEMNLPNITLNDMVLYAVSRTLKSHKYINAHFLGDAFRIFNCVNLGVAVDTERGLLVPVIFNADKLSLSEIASKTKSLAASANAGKLSSADMQNGSFTVTNLGALGIESFTPVINPPQTAILGVCNTIERSKTENGTVRTYQAMGLSLTFDHRAVDGAPAAKFLKDLCANLENFQLLLL